MPHLLGDGLNGLPLHAGRPLGLLLGQLTGMPHDKASLFLRDSPCTVLPRNLPQHTVPMPAAGLLVLGPSGFCSHEGQGGVLLAPRFQLLAHRTGARHQGDHAQPLLQTAAPCPATRGLPVPYDALDALTPTTAALLYGARRLHTRTCLPIPAPYPQRPSAVTTHPQTQEDLRELSAAILPVSVGWTRGSWCLRLVRIRPRERTSRGVLRQPGCRDGIDLQRFEGDSPKDPMEMGGTPRIEEVSEPGIIARGTRSPRLQQRHSAPLFQPSPHLVKGIIPIQHGEHQGFDPTPTREHMRRVGRDEPVENGGNFQAP